MGPTPGGPAALGSNRDADRSAPPTHHHSQESAMDVPQLLVDLGDRFRTAAPAAAGTAALAAVPEPSPRRAARGSW